MEVKMEPMFHTCLIRDGDMAGNRHQHAVTEDDVYFERLCPHCDRQYASLQEMVFWIYGRLTE